METKEITIRVSPQAASLYEAASVQDRRKLDLLLSLKLNEVRSSTRSLVEIMHEASAEAKTQGLTPELLQEILNG